MQTRQASRRCPLTLPVQALSSADCPAVVTDTRCQVEYQRFTVTKQLRARTKETILFSTFKLQGNQFICLIIFL